MKQQTDQHVALPPGPQGHRLRNMWKRTTRYAEFMEELHREYGEIVSFQLPFMNCCIVFDADMIREVLDTEQPTYPPWSPGAIKNAMFEYGCLAVTTDVEMHRKRGELMTSAFSEQRMNAYADIVAEKAEDLLESLQPGQTVNVVEPMDLFTWDCVVKVVLGRDANVPRRIGRDFLDAMKLFVSLDVFPMGEMLKKLPWRAFRRAGQSATALDKVMYAAIRRAHDPSHPGDDVIAHFVRAPNQGIVDWSFSDWSFDNDRAIRDEAVNLMAAYIDAPTAALTFGIYHIARNVPVRERLEQEADDVLGDRPLENSDFGKLRYTQAVFREVLRLEPPAYVMLPKEAVHDCVLGGYRIPKGTLVHVGMRVLHHKPEYWDNPGEFRPERWLGDPPPIGAKCPAHAYIPFGEGPHVCRGAGLAERIFVFAIASIVRHLRLKPVSSAPPKRDDIGVGIKHPVPVTVKAR